MLAFGERRSFGCMSNIGCCRFGMWANRFHLVACDFVGRMIGEYRLQESFEAV